VPAVVGATKVTDLVGPMLPVLNAPSKAVTVWAVSSLLVTEITAPGVTVSGLGE
jgi:hypothetical protein